MSTIHFQTDDETKSGVKWLISDDFFLINLLFRHLCAINNYLPQCW